MSVKEIKGYFRGGIFMKIALPRKVMMIIKICSFTAMKRMLWDTACAIRSLRADRRTGILQLPRARMGEEAFQADSGYGD